MRTVAQEDFPGKYKVVPGEVSRIDSGELSATELNRMIKDQSAEIEAGAPVMITAVGLASYAAQAAQEQERFLRASFNERNKIAKSGQLLSRAKLAMERGYSRGQVYQILLELSVNDMSDHEFLLAVSYCSKRALELLHGGSVDIGEEPIGLLQMSGRSNTYLSRSVRKALEMSQRALNNKLPIRAVLAQIYRDVARDLGLDLVQVLHPKTRDAMGI